MSQPITQQQKSKDLLDYLVEMRIDINNLQAEVKEGTERLDKIESKLEDLARASRDTQAMLRTIINRLRI